LTVTVLFEITVITESTLREVIKQEYETMMITENSLFRPEHYLKPTSLDEASEFLLKYPGSRVIAGGTDLLVEKNPDVRALVDITNLGLDYVESGNGVIKVGACTSFRRIEKDGTLRRGCPSLVEAARTIGGIAIRNEATIGGNVCNAVPSADSPPPLITQDSKVKIFSRKGERIVPLEDFFQHVRKTLLNNGELVTEFQIPQLPPHSGVCFLKIGRSSEDIAIVNVATRVTLGAGRGVDTVRIVLGAVAPVPLRARNAEAKVLNGGRDAIIDAAITAAEETKPISDLRASASYRKEMCRVLTKRALQAAFERAEAN
jgi:carbon-monoxide dehydrogenase medium subunit